MNREIKKVKGWGLNREKEGPSWYICSRAAELWGNCVPLVGLEEESIGSCQHAVGNWKQSAVCLSSLAFLEGEVIRSVTK